MAPSGRELSEPSDPHRYTHRIACWPPLHGGGQRSGREITYSYLMTDTACKALRLYEVTTDHCNLQLHTEAWSNRSHRPVMGRTVFPGALLLFHDVRSDHASEPPTSVP